MDELEERQPIQMKDSELADLKESPCDEVVRRVKEEIDFRNEQYL